MYTYSIYYYDDSEDKDIQVSGLINGAQSYRDAIEFLENFYGKFIINLSVKWLADFGCYEFPQEADLLQLEEMISSVV